MEEDTVISFNENRELIIYVLPIGGSIPPRLWLKYLHLCQKSESIALHELTRPGGRLGDSALKHFSWDASNQIRFRFVPINTTTINEILLAPVDHQEEEPFAVLGICHCPTTKDIIQTVNTFAKAVQNCANKSLLIDTRCFAFGYDFQVPTPSHEKLVLFPDEIKTASGETTTELHAGLEIGYIAVKFIVALEVAITSNKLLQSESDDKIVKQKIFGDFALKIGSPLDAIQFYKSAIDLCNKNSATIVHADALAGLAGAYHSLLKKSSNDDDDDDVVSLAFVIKYGYEAVKLYTKLRCVHKELDILLKMATCTTTVSPFPKKRECLDILHRATLMAIDLETPLQYKLARHAAILCDRLKLKRRSILYIHEMALIKCEEEKWEDGHSLLLLGLKLLPEDSCWPILKVIVYQQLVVVASHLHNSTTLVSTYSVQLLYLLSVFERRYTTTTTSNSTISLDNNSQKSFLQALKESNNNIMKKKSYNRQLLKKSVNIKKLCAPAKLSVDTASTTSGRLRRGSSSTATDTSSSAVDDGAIAEVSDNSRRFMIHTPRMNTPKLSTAVASAIGKGVSVFEDSVTSSPENSFANNSNTNGGRSSSNNIIDGCFTRAGDEDQQQYYCSKDLCVQSQKYIIDSLQQRCEAVELPNNSSRFCEIVKYEAQNDSDKIVPMTRKEKDSNFFYNPFENKSEEVLKWVEDEVGIVNVWFKNLLAVPIRVKNAKLIVKSSSDESLVLCYPTSFSIPERHDKFKVPFSIKCCLQSKSVQQQKLVISGISMERMLGVFKAQYFFKKALVTNVIPRLAKLAITRYSQSSSCNNNNTISVYTGEAKDLILSFDNIGYIPITLLIIEVQHESCVVTIFDNKNSDNGSTNNHSLAGLSWDNRSTNKSMVSLPLLPRTSVQLPLQVLLRNINSSSIQNYEIRIRYGSSTDEDSSLFWRELSFPITLCVKQALKIRKCSVHSLRNSNRFLLVVELFNNTGHGVSSSFSSLDVKIKDKVFTIQPDCLCRATISFEKSKTLDDLYEKLSNDVIFEWKCTSTNASNVGKLVLCPEEWKDCIKEDDKIIQTEVDIRLTCRGSIVTSSSTVVSPEKSQRRCPSPVLYSRAKINEDQYNLLLAESSSPSQGLLYHHGKLETFYPIEINNIGCCEEVLLTLRITRQSDRNNEFEDDNSVVKVGCFETRVNTSHHSVKLMFRHCGYYKFIATATSSLINEDDAIASSSSTITQKSLVFLIS